MPVPDRQRSTHDLIAIDTLTTKPSAPPQIIRSPGAGALDTDQLATVLARILNL
jgi:hypothetical protein